MRFAGSRNGRRSKPRELSKLVPRVLDDLGLTDTSGILQVAERWEAVVGAQVAAHCRPVSLRGGRLEVTVESSVWCQQLQLHRDVILAALRRELGDAAPTDLWLRVG